MLLPIAGLIAGLLIGSFLPVSMPAEYAKYLSVALLAALDSVFGGLRAAVEKKFDNLVFITGFFTNTMMAAGLVYIGERIGIDLYYVALLTFGLRLFQNLAILRRHFLKH
ncbi:small basic family protein|uniref:Small basic protein n=1 Tax=Dendrosporobacter quercicolus TaxID=146817 RepID=A0A1G9XCV8_9FIRM|nr:small basic family protein [Dendrosporobacter quercicolus]NSL49700.1 small basic family protein [Dendrosporobacter quercicolus DSM 1736]SDM94639.1 Small basic protein [Dendrosporobacter quercicolus]